MIKNKKVVTLLVFIFNVSSSSLFSSHNLVDEASHNSSVFNPIAGKSIFPNNDTSTYKRFYEPAPGPFKLRSKISQIPGYSKKGDYRRIGLAYHYGDDGFDKGRGFFKIIKTLSENENNLTQLPHTYALNVFKHSLEAITNLNFIDIINQINGYGIDYALKLYFDVVIQPEDGDLVIYQRSFQKIHSGIYKKSKPNLNSPSGGTVESKIFWDDPNIYQHDIFLCLKILEMKLCSIELKQLRLEILKV